MWDLPSSVWQNLIPLLGTNVPWFEQIGISEWLPIEIIFEVIDESSGLR
jgi:hypothetical protein